MFVTGDRRLELHGRQLIQRAEPPTEFSVAQAALAVEAAMKLASQVGPQARILWAVFVVVLFRHVVLRHFVRAHFSLVRIGRIFHTAHNSRLERLSFF